MRRANLIVASSALIAALYGCTTYDPDSIFDRIWLARIKEQWPIDTKRAALDLTDRLREELRQEGGQGRDRQLLTELGFSCQGDYRRIVCENTTRHPPGGTLWYYPVWGDHMVLAWTVRANLKSGNVQDLEVVVDDLGVEGHQ